MTDSPSSSPIDREQLIDDLADRLVHLWIAQAEYTIRKDKEVNPLIAKSPYE